MIKIRASCAIIGKNFSPAAFAKNSFVQLIDAHEPGANCKVGRYQGQPNPYGQATIEISNKAEKDWSRFDDLLTALENNIETLRQAGAEDLCLSVSIFHDGQCNFGFSKEEFNRIAVLNVDMAISCYSEELE
jgi:hypothetical protein